MKKYLLCASIVVSLLVLVSLSFAQTGTHRMSKKPAGGTHQGGVMLTPDQMKWGPAPPALPAGAQMAVLSGNPSKAGAPFAIRVKFPDGYRVPPHWHPTDENVVVLEGTIALGMGDKADAAVEHELTAGSFALMPKGMRHFARAIGETTIQIYGVGPFAINYVNPADNPMKKAMP